MNGDPLMIACPDLPQHLRERLMLSLKAASGKSDPGRRSPVSYVVKNIHFRPINH